VSARRHRSKIEIKKVQTWMGATYRIYIDGMYMGAASTPATAKEGARRMLPIYEQIKEKEKKLGWKGVRI
jgi:hypothetical protein